MKLKKSFGREWLNGCFVTLSKAERQMAFGRSPHIKRDGCEKARLLKCWKVDSERHSVSASVLNGAVIPQSLTLIQIDLVS